MDTIPFKIGPVLGHSNKYNEIICTTLRYDRKYPTGITVYFGGDVQNLPEEMASHRDHDQYLNWNLLNMITLLSMKFPSDLICVIRPKRMKFKTFSCFDNFVTSNDLGTPTYTEMHGALLHLKILLSNLLKSLKPNSNEANVDSCSSAGENNSYYSPKSINLIGFSKGCVVLNQLITEVHTIAQNSTEENKELLEFWKQVRSIYWLDGGHSGGKNTWITNRPILNTIASFSNLSLFIHVTPYQIKDERRPWIGKECKNFYETLRKAKANIEYKVHFEHEVPSLENHFRVLSDFK